MHKKSNITPKTWNINQNRNVTRFANMKSKQAYEVGGEGRNSLVYIPGFANEDRKDLLNVAFASADKFGAKPDLDNPIAKFEVKTDKFGLPLLDYTLYDQYASEVQTIDDYVARYGYNEGMKQIATANIVNSITVDSTKALNILDRVLGLQTRQYMLEMAVTKIPAPQLTFNVDSYVEGAVQAKVPEMDTPDLQSHTESRTPQTLFKNVGHIAQSEEAGFKATHNTMGLRENWTIRDLARLINQQLATEIETATDVAGSDWGAVGSGLSTNNPANDINTVMTTIEGNGFDVDYLVMHNRPSGDFVTNSWIKGNGIVGASPAGISAVNYGSKMYQVQGFPSAIVDQAKTNTICTVMSKDAVWLGVGPTVIASYENVVQGIQGKVIKQWFFPFLSQSGAIRDLTGISA